MDIKNAKPVDDELSKKLFEITGINESNIEEAKKIGGSPELSTWYGGCKYAVVKGHWVQVYCVA